MNKNDEIYIRELYDLPSDEHYVVLVDNSFSHDTGYGDGRNPSYSIHKSLSYMVFHDVERLKTWIIHNDENRFGEKKAYKIILAKPVTVSKHVTIGVD